MAVLSQCVVAFDERRASPTSNVGTLGSAGDVTWTGTKRLVDGPTAYVYWPGSASNVLTVPDAAALDITGDLELVFRVSADDWTPATSNRYPFGKWNTSQQSWLVELTTGGLLRLYWSTTGTDTLSSTSGAAVPFTDDTNYWVKITFDVDNGAGGSQGRFYYAADQATEPTSWTQLTAPAAGVGTTSIFAGTANVHVGAAQSLTPNFPGRFYRFILRSGIGGTTVLDVDASVLTDDGATSFTATTGQTLVGARLAWVDLTTTRRENLGELRASEQSDIGGTDIADTVARMQQVMLVLEASQAGFAKLSSLSLFDMLR